MIAHRLEQNERTHQVVIVVFDGLCDTLAHGLEPREVDDGVDGMFPKDAVENRAVADVRLVEEDVLARDLFGALERDLARVGKIVDDDDVMTMVQQLYQSVRADEPGSARD